MPATADDFLYPSRVCPYFHQLERAYYLSSACGHGFCPRDGHLGTENTSLSPALTRMVGTVGVMVSFQEGSELLTELAGVAVDAKQVERTAEALGKEIAEDERHCTEPSHTLALPQTLYLGMDGYALDHSRLQCHHRSPLLKTQWSFSRLLGAQIRTQGRMMIHHFLGVHP